MLLKSRLRLIRKKTKEINSKTIIGKDEKYLEKVETALLYLSQEQVEHMLKLTKE